jgi:hypothetical protein
MNGLKKLKRNKMTAVEWFNEEINKLNVGTDARVFIAKLFGKAKEMETQQQGYSEEEVKKLLIKCKDRFGGSDLDDYVEDSKVIAWFEQNKKK